MELDQYKPHNINELLDLIVDRITRFTMAENVIVYLYDADDQMLFNRAGKDIEVMELQFPLGKGLVGKSLDELRPYIIPDVSKDKDFDPKVDTVAKDQIKSLLIVPISNEKKDRIGVIELINKKEGAFTHDDLTFVEAMSAQAGISIENTVLFGELLTTRDREKKLIEEIKTQNSDLQKAFMQLDEKSQKIEETSKRIRKVRNIGFTFIGVVVLIIFYFLWPSSSSSSSPAYVPTKAPTFSTEQGQTYERYTVTPQPVTLPLTTSGILQPAQMVNVFAPFAGIIKDVNFQFGSTVEKGQKLIELDSTKIESEYRTAQVDEIKKKQDLLKIKNWEKGSKMTEAYRSLAKAEDELALAKDEYESSQLLYNKGAISKRDLDAAKRKIASSEDALLKANESLEATRQEDNPQEILFKDYDWQNAKLKETQLKGKLERAILYSPVPGVAIKPLASSSGSKDQGGVVQNVERGISVAEDAIFLSIADLSRLSVSSTVDEIEVNQVRPGQDVTITGDGFKGVTLHGEVTYVSSEAKSSGRKPQFEIKVTTDPLTDEQRKAVKLGMSAYLSINTYTNPNALMVPFRAVQITREGKFVYRITEGATQPEKVQVETGITTPVTGTVEIVNGLNSGDTILLL